MPNWCENELTIRGKGGVLACLEAIRGEPDEDGPRHVDFQKIVPMPAVLEGTVAGSTSDLGRVLLGDDVMGQELLSRGWVKDKGITDLEGLRLYIQEKHTAAEAEGIRAIRAYQETGCYDWCEWRAGTLANFYSDGHWGTKWNACYFDPLDNTTDQRAVIGFDTAWSPPVPVIMELSRQFPKLAFTLRYWECGCGFRGILRVKAGKVLYAANYDYKGNRGG
jgi:hypothetical protein